MANPDLNLLLTLDVLLAECNVARAARRLRLSPSAMSRALARLRATTGDPLLVRAGRAMVPTPHALELREQVSRLVQDAQAALRRAGKPDLLRLARSFTLRTREGFVENFGFQLLSGAAAQAPGVQLRFVDKPDKDSGPLRDASVDLEIGVVGQAMGPELRAQALFRDRWVGVVRTGHLLSDSDMTPVRYAGGEHVAVSRRGLAKGPIDAALAQLGLARHIATTVAGFGAALALARGSELIATVPERHTGILRTGMFSFPLPVQLPQLSISMLWHPRLHADPAHAWLRGLVQQVCTEAR